MDNSDYFSKWEMIAKDHSKFMYLGPANKYNKLPKNHKKDCRLRTNIPMIGSAQHKLIQYLSRLLQLASDRYAVFCMKDLFTFENLA